MAIDTTSPRTRRAILLGALGGVAASVATAVGRTSSVTATDGDIVHVGHKYGADRATEIDSAFATAWKGNSGSGIAIYGQSLSNSGVFGGSSTSVGVHGDSASSVGVYGTSTSPQWAAVLGLSYHNSTGVAGYSGGSGGAAVTATPKTGVYGYANKDASAVGVQGQSVLGTGGLFSAGTSGIALRATGRVKFDQAAGMATIPAATRSIIVTPGTDLADTSAVVATLMGNAGGTTTVQRIAVNVTASSFTIYLTANTTVAVKVAWHVFG